MPEAVYLLCALTSAACAALLIRQHRLVRTKRRGGLLVWSSICFSGLAASTAMLFIELVLFSSVNLSLIPAALGAAAPLALVVGLIWETD